MTIAVTERVEAMKRVLYRLSELSWDADRCTFGDADLVDASPLGTTLGELEHKGFIQVETFLPGNPQPYCLTSAGWFEAHRLAGRFDTDDFNQRRGRLCAALKDAVKGRRDEALLTCAEVAQSADCAETIRSAG